MKIIAYQPGMIPEAGNCYSGIPNDDYHNTFIDWYSSSDLKNLLRSLEYFWMLYTEKKNRKEREYKLAFEVGQAYHDACGSLAMFDDLSLFEENTVSFEGKSISKEFNRVKDLYPDKSVVPVESFENIPLMAKKTVDAGKSLNVFYKGDIELSFFWIDKETGVKLKCRPDYFRQDITLIVDFKSTKDHSEKGFPKEIANYNYHFSAAMYLDGVEQVSGERAEEFLFIATANTKPFEVGFYPLNDASIEQGEAMYRKTLRDLSENKPQEPTFKKIGVPFWALTEIEREYR